MKSILIIFLCLFFISTNMFAQDGEASGGFKKENLFTGGTLNLLFGSSMTSVGATPCLGYSLSSYLDAGITLGVDYTSTRDYAVPGDKLRQTIITPGAFIRLFPTQTIFGIANLEFNQVSFHYIPAVGSTLIEDRRKLSSQSTLVGAGYASGRNQNQRSFYYLSVLWDVGNDPGSPYKDNIKRSVPIIRAGYHIALFQGKR